MLPRPTFSALRASGGKAREIVFGNLAKSLLLAAIEDSHEMARKTFHQHPAIKIVEPFIVERRGKGPQPRLAFAHCHEADHGAEHKPGRRFILTGPRRPRETHTADQPAVYQDGIGPIEADRLLGRRACGKRIAERANPHIYSAPRGRSARREPASRLHPAPRGRSHARKHRRPRVTSPGGMAAADQARAKAPC